MFKSHDTARPSLESVNGTPDEIGRKTTSKKLTQGRANLFALGAAILFIVTAVLPAKASPALQASTLTFTASSDAQVKESSPKSNYGGTAYLQVDGDASARVESYILFTVSGLPDSISSARVRVYDTTNGSSNGPELYGTGTSWNESRLTWRNRPNQTTPALGNAGSVGTNSWVEYDVTSHVTGNGTYSFVLVADSNDGLTFSSREGVQAPQLVVTTGSGPVSTPTVQGPSEPVVLVGAGDISSCSNNNDELTAQLLDQISGTVFTTGDNAYPNGAPSDYTNCYEPTWGRHKARTKPVPGNHEYNTSGAAGYFQYFNNIPAYYAYDLGDWRIYALNSEIGVTSTSAQVQWLKADLEANPHQCVLAYWHSPRWSSGANHGSDASMQTLWQTLYDAGAELVLNGHDHTYERFAPMNASGSAVSQGLREIVVGTGGAGAYQFGTVHPSSEVRDSSAYGVLKLTLNATSYDWQFVPVAGKTFTDSGSTSCR